MRGGWINSMRVCVEGKGGWIVSDGRVLVVNDAKCM